MSEYTNPAYYYLHTNGELIKKSLMVCEMGTTPQEYFDSDFVFAWWHIQSHTGYEKMVADIKIIKAAWRNDAF